MLEVARCSQQDTVHLRPTLTHGGWGTPRPYSADDLTLIGDTKFPWHPANIAKSRSRFLEVGGEAEFFPGFRFVESHQIVLLGAVVRVTAEQ